MNQRQKLVQQKFLNNEEAVIKRLKTVYDQSMKDINGKISNLDSSIAQLQKAYNDIDGDDIGDLAKAVLGSKKNFTPEEAKETLQSMIQSKVYQKKYQEGLQKQVGDVLDKMHTEQFKTVSEYLDKCYEEGFLGTMYDLQGQGIPMCFPLDQEQMVRAVQLDSKIVEGYYQRLGEDVAMLKKRITAEVSRGISSGMRWEQVAQQLANKTTIGYTNAIRIARTEGHRIQCQAGMDACGKARDMGADVVKQWDSTLDGVTRHSHVILDGEVRELDEVFSNGLRFPGDPHGIASEVINCRCALLQRARWAVGGGFTKMNNFTKQLETFESPETYKEFKKGFFSKENRSYMNFVDALSTKYGTKNLEAVLDAMNTREYNHYSRLLARNPLFNKKADINDNSFAGKLASTELSPHPYEYRTAEEFWEARKAFIANGGEESSYLDDVFRGEFDISVSWGGDDGKHKIAQIENTLAELQKQYPINPSRELEYGTTIKRIAVCDYDHAYMYLPDGSGDRRLVNSAIGQVFENDGKQAVIAFDRNYMYQSIEKAMEERATAISLGKVLDSVNGSAPQTVVMHEWGHLQSNHITNAMIYGEPTAQDYWQWYKGLSKEEIRVGLSEYATTNRGEFEAECFAELMMPNPRPLALKFKEYLDKCIELGY